MAKVSNPISSPEIIEMSSRTPSEQDRWTPFKGPETFALLSHLNLRKENEKKVEEEAVAVLSKCLPPQQPSGSETGLIIGYVQSGKTMSFTTVAALARDNGYRLIIIITGTTLNLVKQSTERLERDLGLRERIDRKWKFYTNPKPRPDVSQRIETALRSDDSAMDADRQTVLITVMKNHSHLNNLIKLLSSIDLTNIPTLVIDDEGDQAGLNTLVRKNKESTTYRRLLDLRRLLPQHTFLQYTATPQALLLINIIDVLSPSFAEMLTPGPAYTGGTTFFESKFELIRRIPSTEIPSKDHHLVEPPESLHEAMRVFFLGVAAGILSGSVGNRSMMVHPSKETMQHANYSHWVRQAQREWKRILDLEEDDPDRCDLLDEFEQAYADLSKTVEEIPPFQELASKLRPAINITIVTEVNAAKGQTPEVDWRQEYAHILVGGEVLNRGYTVKGLTVSYMPRGKGVGNADTIQQRARWFGYKADYLGYCRVYLADETRWAYENYVEHEEKTRQQLSRHKSSGKSLHEWRRAFFLSSDMRPTRNNVIDQDYIRGGFAHSWFDPHAPHESEDAIRDNQQVISHFLSRLQLQPDEGHSKRTEAQKHLVNSHVSLRLAYRELLTKLRWAKPSDSQRFTGLLLQIGDHLEQHRDEECTVYLMSKGNLRERSLDADNNIKQLFQGPNPDKSGEYYPGDKMIRTDNRVTIQIHMLKLKSTRYENVPLVAVWIPNGMSSSWLVQEQEEIK